MQRIFGTLVVLAVAWGLSAPAQAQELFPFQAISGGSGTPCTSSDSTYVPTGYSCVTADDDEFTGSSGGVTYNSGDTVNSKWHFQSGGNPSLIQGNGYIELGMHSGGTFNGYSGGGFYSLFNIPDAPSYVEWRRRYVPYETSQAIAQIWTTSNQSSPFTAAHEETDVDMGEGCGGAGASTNYPTGICSSWTDWSNYCPSPNQNMICPTFSSTYYGSTSISNGSDWHVIGMQRLTTPSPNGSIVITVDGMVQNTLETGMLYNAFPSLEDTGYNDVLEFDLFCSDASPGCSADMVLDVDYVRVYTPSGS